MTGYWSNITDEMIESASDDTNPLGELGGGADPFGEEEEDGNSRKRTADGEWNEADHPRKEDGEFTEAGGAGELHPDIAPYFEHTNQALEGKPEEALAWVRGGEGRFTPGAIPHPEIGGGIGLLHGYRGEKAPDWRGGFGVSHIDAKRPGHLDEAVKVIPSLPVIETITDAKTGRVLGKVLSDGWHRAVVSMDLRGHARPEWLLTSYINEKRKA